MPTTDELFEQLRTGKLAGDGDAYDSDNQGDNGGDAGEASETAETADGDAAAAGEGKAESDDDEPLTDHAKRLQENIHRLHASVMASTHAAVKAGAYATFLHNDCMNELAALSTTDDRLRWLSLQAFAFVLLEAVTRRSEKQLVEEVGWRTKKACRLIQSESATRARPRLLQSIGMTADGVEAAVRAVDEQLSESVDCIIAERLAMPTTTTGSRTTTPLLSAHGRTAGAAATETGGRTQDTGHRSQQTGCRKQDAGRRTQDAGYDARDPGAEPPKAGHANL